MDLIDRYLNAVAAQLPQDERADIVAELRDLILSRFEAKEEELGRALTEDEQEAILHEIGHPLVVAARYRKGPDSLVGPELFPYWLFAVKAGLLLMLAVQAVVLLINLISGPADAGQSISQAFHGFFNTGLALVGAATVVAALFEHYGVRPKWLTSWKVKDLGAFELADPAAWGATVGASAKARPWTAPGAKPKAWPGGEYLFSFLATGVFVLWWVGIIHFPGLMHLEFGGQDATVSGAPVWTTLYGAILFYAVAQMAIDLASLARPHAVRLRAAAEAAIAGAGLWLTWAVFEAGEWFTLSRGGETARIAGDWSLLDFDRLRALGEGTRDLAGVAASLSVIMTWVLALVAVSLVFKIAANLWRLVQPEARRAG
ncbi:HAAS signaling domain-containing protein [Brevundimonas sp.]|uniref:HAAS signaling domain-containing protein n=1 Tax=Brevundimonas sp. TaxID=1871086 RepID=UPI002ED9337B